MQVRLEGRCSASLNANLSYTWSKMMEAVSFLDGPGAGRSGLQPGPHASPGSVNIDPTSLTFGKTTTEFAWPRVIQFGLKALF